MRGGRVSEGVTRVFFFVGNTGRVQGIPDPRREFCRSSKLIKVGLLIGIGGRRRVN